MDKETLKALALAQFTGFAHAKNGYGIIDLVNSMGLTEEEWDEIKNDEIKILSDADTLDINEHFSRQKQIT